MPSKLIVLPTEVTINRAGLSSGNGKRVARSDADSDSDECAATGAGATAARPREDDVESEAYPDSEAEEDAKMTHRNAKQANHEVQPRKKVRSEGSSSSGSAVTTSSRGSTSTSAKLATITVTSETRKPTAWEMHRRKQEAKLNGR
jgi:hypothetical protein